MLYVISNLLFLALNKKPKPHYNMLNSLGAMISWFIKLMEIYLGKCLKWNIILFRSYFSQYTSQYFYTKNIVFYCIWSHLSFAAYFIMYWDNQRIQITLKKKIEKFRLWQLIYTIFIYKWRQTPLKYVKRYGSNDFLFY